MNRNHLQCLRGMLVIAAVTCARIATAQSSLHATLLPSYPTTISNNAVTSVDNGDGTSTLFSFMGTTEPRRPNFVTTAAYRLDWPNGNWMPIADAPALNGRGRIGANAISVAGDVYLLGGYTIPGTEITDDRLFRYNPNTDDYTQLASVPVEVDDTVVGVFEDRYIFLASGWHGPIFDNVLTVQYYDTHTDTWHETDAMPGPASGVFGHAGTVIGNQIISTDGVTTDGGFNVTDRMFVGEIVAGANPGELDVQWAELPAHPGLPTYRAAASQGDDNGQMLLIGGTDNPYNFNGIGYNGVPSSPVDQALLFDPTAGDWQTLSVTGDYLPSMDHRGLVRVGDGWVTVGGMLEPRFATDRVVMYTVPEPVFGIVGMALVFFLGRRRCYE